MALVSDLINEAFLDIGAIAAGEAVTTAEQTDAFLRLNQLLAQWSSENLMVFNRVHQSFALVAGTDLYSLGGGGTLATTGGLTPVRVTGAASVSGTFRSNCKLVSFAEFAATVMDPLGSTSVLAKVVAADNAFPLINIRVFPVPATGPGNLQLDYWTAIAAFANVGATVNLPPGFEQALVKNLALVLFPQYARPGNSADLIAGLAQSTKATIVALNQEIQGVQPAPAGGAGA